MFLKCVKIFIKHTKLHGIDLVLIKISKSCIAFLRLLLLQQVIMHATSWINKTDFDMKSLVFSICLFMSTYLMENFFEYIFTRENIKCEWLLTKNLNNEIYLKLMKLKYQNYEDTVMYNYIIEMDEDAANKIKDCFIAYVDVCCLFISMMGISVIYVQVSPLMVVGLLIVVAVAAVFSITGMNKLNQLKYEQSKDQRELNYYLDLLTEKNSLLELIIFRARDFIMHKRIIKENKVVRELFLKSIIAGFIYNLSTIITVTWIIFSLFFCSHRLIEGFIDIALFAVVVQSSLTMLSDIESFSYQVADATKNTDICKYYDEFMHLTEMNDDEEETAKLDSEICVSFKNVSFCYPGSTEEVLSNISFELETGKKYAIVGENGSGKSTIVKLIFGLFNPQRGSIVVDKENIGVVYQDYMKYEMSIRENVAIGNTNIISNDMQIKELLAESSSLDIVDKASGIDKKLGRLYPDSIDLSEGQWQHIAIARGLAASKKFVVFDEPTASMDPIAESRMYKSFLSASQNRGSLIISHRLASAKLADCIFVLKDHTIYEKGNHEQLMKANGYYAKLYKDQSAWYKS